MVEGEEDFRRLMAHPQWKQERTAIKNQELEMSYWTAGGSFSFNAFGGPNTPRIPFWKRPRFKKIMEEEKAKRAYESLEEGKKFCCFCKHRGGSIFGMSHTGVCVNCDISAHSLFEPDEGEEAIK